MTTKKLSKSTKAILAILKAAAYPKTGLWKRDLTDDEYDTISRALGLPDAVDPAAASEESGRHWTPERIAQWKLENL